MVVTAGGAPVDNLDLEGILARAEGGFWLASEGNNDRANRLLRVDADGIVEEDMALPEAITAGMTTNGLEGVASTGSGADEIVWLAVQREWADDERGFVKLVSYTPATGDWGVVRYPLEPTEVGWVGLSEITPLSDGRFAIIERDNQIGGAAKLKALFLVSLDGVTPAAPGGEAPTVEKTLLHDFVPDLLATHGYIHDQGGELHRRCRRDSLHDDRQ
jgi:hypothetical protein